MIGLSEDNPILSQGVSDLNVPGQANVIKCARTGQCDNSQFPTLSGLKEYFIVYPLSMSIIGQRGAMLNIFSLLLL